MKGAFWLLLLLVDVYSTLVIDDSIQHFISWANINEAPDQEEIMRQFDNPSPDYVKIRSADDELFFCQMPKSHTEKSQSSAAYSGPSPSDLLQPLYKEKICSYRPESYWIYEVCHGRYVLQYHEDKQKNGQPVRSEYYLGNFRQDYASMTPNMKEQFNPPKKMIGDEERAYFSVEYSHGTNCDITGKPRTTVVQYACDPDARNVIHEIAEISSCNYEVIVLTSRLCSHPAFKLKPKKEKNIVCYNMDNDVPPKPASLLELEIAQDNTFKSEYEILQIDLNDVKEVKELFEQIIEEMKEDLTPDLKLSGKRTERTEGTDTLASNRIIVQDTVNRILSGRECIYGGQGWWKYEFCYGQKVIQYHEEQNGARTELILGEFDPAVHRAWVDVLPEQRKPKKYGEVVNQVNHLYTKGDICAETKAHRSVEVRIRCKRSEGAPLAVVMSLQEPKTCEYILTIESERFCEPIQYADEYGIIKLEKNIPILREGHTEL